MTPKEKADGLINKFIPHIAGADRYNSTLNLYDKDIAKQCALIAVDEIIRTLNCDLQESDLRGLGLINLILYWMEVKKEIEKL